MPQLIESIDRIARRLKRDVLCVHFDKNIFPEPKTSSVFQEFLKYLEQHNIKTRPCIPFVKDSFILSYSQNDYWYLDVPFDKQNERYIALSRYLENADGSMRIKGVTFLYMPLDMAQENAYQDEDDFLENL